MQALMVMFMFLGSVVPVAPCRSLACVCVRTTNPEPTIKASAAIFVGRVLSVAGDSGYPDYKSPDGLPYFMDSVSFVVERGWKGDPPDTVYAAIVLTGPDCPTRFAPAERYLVYAERRGGGYTVGICTRTSHLDSRLAKQDLRVLGHPRYRPN